MPQVRTLVRMLAVFSLVATLAAGLATAGVAQTSVGLSGDFPTTLSYDTNECYFASVSNGENFGLGASQTSVTVQNLSNELGVVYLSSGTGDGFAKGQYALLAAGAAKTFSAAGLNIAAGSAQPVVVRAFTFDAAQAKTFDAGISIGCVAKQAVGGNNLPSTEPADSAVSGYNATSGREVDFFDDLYLPIVQTNCGPGGCWNTLLRIANVGPFDNAAVTVRFFPADDGQGSLDTGFQMQQFLNQGQLWTLDLARYVDEGWVGSAHIYTDDSVVAIADRYKVGTNMWITNTASNAVAESSLQLPNGPSNMPYVLYAPDVRMDYNAWNTGISVANTVNADNTVNIQYFGSDGNAPQAQTQRLSAHGMTYFYNPSSPSEDGCAQPVDQVVTCDFVGGAVILSQQPVAVAIDGVKYFGNDAAVGQAFTYNATGNVWRSQAAPLVQKGVPSTGMGATSGITFLNVNAGGTYVTTSWVNPSGFEASNMGPSVVWVPGFATGFVYSMTQQNVPNGFIGSAVIQSDLPIAATSANVDYQVSGDGTAIWNLYNPCGFYRAVGSCRYTLPAAPQATKTFDVRPLAANPAWICVYDATAGQDGKPLAPQDDCLPRQVFKKGADAPGQDDVRTYVAADWFTFMHHQFDENAGYEIRPAPGLSFAPLLITVDYETNRITFDGLPAWAEPMILYWPTVNGVQANLSCSDVAGFGTSGPEPDGIPIGPGGQVSGAALDAAGDLSKAIIILPLELGENTLGYCGKIELGTLRLETPAEMQQRLGTVVPPFQTDGDGKASVDLPAGCYFFGVSAEGFATQYSSRECLAAGTTKSNAFDLVVDDVTAFKPVILFTGYLDTPNNRFVFPASSFSIHVASNADISGNYDEAFAINAVCAGALITSGTTSATGMALVEVPVDAELCIVADPNGDGIDSSPVEHSGNAYLILEFDEEEHSGSLIIRPQLP